MRTIIKFLFPIICAVFLSSFSVATESPLKPLPGSPADKVGDGNKAQLPCTGIVEAMQDYTSLARGNEQAFADFILEVTGIMDEWYQKLSPLEGSASVIPRGTFDTIRKGSDQIYDVVEMVYENSDQLEERRQRILNSLKVCL